MSAAPDLALDSLDAAVRRVREGGLVAFPTETVWGLGADATQPEAVARLRVWKGRDGDKPVSVLVEDLASLDRLGIEATATARALALAFWPGPLTLVVPAPEGCFASGVAAGDGSIGLRCSPDPTAAALARALARAGAGPLTATSLNRGGEPPARDLDEARALCRAHPGPGIVEPLAASPVCCSAPSTVVDCTGPGLQLIREGAISADALAEAVLRETDAPKDLEASR